MSECVGCYNIEQDLCIFEWDKDEQQWYLDTESRWYDPESKSEFLDTIWYVPVNFCPVCGKKLEPPQKVLDRDAKQA